MVVRRNPMVPSIVGLFKQLDKILVDMQDVDQLIEIGIVADGEAKAYALVWEWGNVRQTKAGPKTTLGINPDGSQVWLTIQAPFGYIRVNTPKYWDIVYSELDKVNFFSKNVDKQLERASEKISERILELIQRTVPVDTGQLRDALRAFVSISMTDD